MRLRWVRSNCHGASVSWIALLVSRLRSFTLEASGDSTRSRKSHAQPSTHVKLLSAGRMPTHSEGGGGHCTSTQTSTLPNVQARFAYTEGSTSTCKRTWSPALAQAWIPESINFIPHASKDYKSKLDKWVLPNPIVSKSVHSGEGDSWQLKPLHFTHPWMSLRSGESGVTLSLPSIWDAFPVPGSRTKWKATAKDPDLSLNSTRSTKGTSWSGEGRLWCQAFTRESLTSACWCPRRSLQIAIPKQQRKDLWTRLVSSSLAFLQQILKELLLLSVAKHTILDVSTSRTDAFIQT